MARSPQRGPGKRTQNRAPEELAPAVVPGAREPSADVAGSGFAALLRPDRRTVAFTGRAAELGELRAWRTSDPARAVRLLYGEAGTGKTRLALQVAAEHEADGGQWQLVPAGREADAVAAARAATAGPLLLVVEQAETRKGLGELLRLVQENPGRARVLLVARVLGEWWDRLIEAADPVVARMLTETKPLRLTAPVSVDASDADLAEAAVPYFARALSVAVPEQVSVQPADRRVPMLVLHAAALVALLRSYPYPAASVQVIIGDDALDELLEHEARRWRRAASAAWLPAGAALVKQVVAASALLGAASVGEAADVVARVPGVGDCPLEERLRWAQWLERLYPADPNGRPGALQPDMVAETHVVGQLAADPDLARSCLRDLPAEHAEYALTVLGRACAHHDRARSLVLTALRDDLARLAIPAARVALQVGGDLGSLLADALDDGPARARVLTDIALGMPYPSMVLARAQLAAIARVRTSLPAGTEPEMMAELDDRESRLLAELGGDAGRPSAREIAGSRNAISRPRPGQAHPDLDGSAAGSAVEPAQPARPRPGRAHPDLDRSAAGSAVEPAPPPAQWKP